MQTDSASARPRHSVPIRVTHWVSTLSFVVLVVSGIAILLAHPRLYRGESGAVGTPSLIDLPLPFVLDVPIRGPGHLHFLHLNYGRVPEALRGPIAFAPVCANAVPSRFAPAHS